MIITLPISPELAAKLIEETARLDCSLETVALSAIEESLHVKTIKRRTSREKWQQELHAWIASHRPVSHAVDERLSRIDDDDQ